MAKLNPYLNFDGTCEEAFLFYRSVFGGEFRGEIFKMKDIPDMEIPVSYTHLQVISVRGQLTDHYNPVNKTINLSEPVYNKMCIRDRGVHRYL